MWAGVTARREWYREMVPLVFDATADLYHQTWGEHFHLAIFADGASIEDFDTALERTHEHYFDAVRAASAQRILELATGGGAFAEWMARRSAATVVGIDLCETQLARAHRRAEESGLENPCFLRHDIMQVENLEEAPFDAAVCLDAGCYLPDKREAVRQVATRLRPGARFLLVDWCRSAAVTGLQEELILEPFYRSWGIPEMETARGYEQAFVRAGFRLLQVENLSERVAPNWERGYRAAQRMLAEIPTPVRLLQMTAFAIRRGEEGVRVLKDQFYAALLAKVAADAGLLRCTLLLAEKC